MRDAGGGRDVAALVQPSGGTGPLLITLPLRDLIALIQGKAGVPGEGEPAFRCVADFCEGAFRTQAELTAHCRELHALEGRYTLG